MQKKLFPFLLALLAGASPALSQQPALEQPVAEQPAAPEKPVEVAPVHSAEEELAALRPVLIGRKYLEQARQRLAVQLARISRNSGRNMDNPDQWFEDNALVVRDFFADVQIMYALEFKEAPQLVSHGMMQRWGMDADRLHQRALANLDRAGEIDIKQVAKLPWLHVIETGDGYAASRVLLHWRWAELTLKLGEPFILGMPTRDVVVFTATQEAEKIAQLRDTVDTVERYQGRPISRKLFQWTPQGWIEFVAPLQQAQEQRRQQAEQHGGAKGEMVETAAKADADVARPAADAQQGSQPRQENAGDEHRDQQHDQPLQHGIEEKSGTTEEKR